MARRRVETTEAKPSVAERTVPMFQEPGEASSAPAPTTAPLGTLTTEQRDAEYQKDLADERDAIVNEPPLADAGALGAGFFGKASSPLEAPEKEVMIKDLPKPGFTPPTGPSQLGDEGEEVTCTKGEEMYGKPGQFSTYRVGPFSGTTRVRPGETRSAARRRLMDELNAFADEERERAKKAFLSHYPNAFT